MSSLEQAGYVRAVRQEVDLSDSVATTEPDLYLLIRLLSAQLLALAVTGAAFYLMAPVKGRSAVIGGLIFMVPNTYFLILALRVAGTHLLLDAAQGFYKGQMGKLTVCAVGFALVFKFYDPLHAPSAFGGFVIMMIVHLALVTTVSARLAEPGRDSSKNQ